MRCSCNCSGVDSCRRHRRHSLAAEPSANRCADTCRRMSRSDSKLAYNSKGARFTGCFGASKHLHDVVLPWTSLSLVRVLTWHLMHW